MSGTVPRSREAGPQPEALATSGGQGSRGRGRWVALCAVAAVAAGLVAGWRAGVFSAVPSSGSGTPGVAAPATATVVREDIAATTPVAATLGMPGLVPCWGGVGGR
jgi:hypothetical protein